MTTTLSSKGQVVIPKEIRRVLGISAGVKLDCGLEDGKIVLKPVNEAPRARVVHKGDRVYLVAPEGAPQMTPELVSQILSEE